MEVTRESNLYDIYIHTFVIPACFLVDFNDVLPQVEEAIRNATFLSIDCEFTGLNTVRDINPYDTQEQYYKKVRNTSRNFLVIQYGLTAFRLVFGMLFYHVFINLLSCMKV